MDYTVKRLAGLAGVSARTLRYYDEIGLLKPARINASGYRIYGQAELDLLQQILCYREFDVPLEEIRALLYDPAFDRTEALLTHCRRLQAQRGRLDRLIATLEKTLSGAPMEDGEKFEGFKRDLVAQNQRDFGEEIVARYGEEAVARSNERLLSTTAAAYNDLQALEARFEQVLLHAMQTGDAAGPLALEACALHRQWLCHYWDQAQYSRQAHAELGRMYVGDARFRAHYDRISPGAAQFFCDALQVYAAESGQ